MIDNIWFDNTIHGQSDEANQWWQDNWWQRQPFAWIWRDTDGFYVAAVDYIGGSEAHRISTYFETLEDAKAAYYLLTA